MSDDVICFSFRLLLLFNIVYFIFNFLAMYSVSCVSLRFVNLSQSRDWLIDQIHYQGLIKSSNMLVQIFVCYSLDFLCSSFIIEQHIQQRLIYRPVPSKQFLQKQSQIATTDHWHISKLRDHHTWEGKVKASREKGSLYYLWKLKCCANLSLSICRQADVMSDNFVFKLSLSAQKTISRCTSIK